MRIFQIVAGVIVIVAALMYRISWEKSRKEYLKRTGRTHDWPRIIIQGIAVIVIVLALLYSLFYK
jgi:TRAP-type C4-dicarboxylate transport system permease small subunit